MAAITVCLPPPAFYFVPGGTMSSVSQTFQGGASERFDLSSKYRG